MIKEEKEIPEPERLKMVQCKSCGSYRTKLSPINIEYRLTKELGPRIMGYQEKPFIGEATKLTKDIRKDCKDCDHTEWLRPEDVRYFIDGYLGVKE